MNAAEDCGDKKAATLAKELNTLWGHLWTFVHTDGVEPTNNEGERDIRPAVLWRKGSFGTWSDNGQRFVERSLTISTTARKLGVHLFGFLVDACHALHHQRPAPTLYAATP
ncbi:Transposase IS66 family protein [compost metagenome]